LLNIKNIFNIRTIATFCSFSLCVYFLIKSISSLIKPDITMIDIIFIIIFLSGEFYFMILSLGYMLTILNITKKTNISLKYKIPIEEPSVAVIVAARHEPKNILENTFSTLKALDYGNKHIYFLDDSSDETFIKDADELSRQYEVNLYRRKERHGAKAGIINDFLKNAGEKYIVIFDADQNPVPDFIKKLVPIMESNSKLAFIQTPQFYTNIDVSPVAKGAAIQQAIFYENICEGKSSRNAMFCCGTNVIFRREALLDVGGFDEKSITEDFATSIKFHLKGYESLYHNKVSAFGMAPENLVNYFKQQIRWSAGTVDVLRKIIFYFFKDPFKLKFSQWWEYFLSGIYYFIGWAFFIMMAGPILYLIFNVPASYGQWQIYLYPFLLYFITNLYVFYYSLKEKNYKFNEIYHGVIISFLIFPILLKSTIYGLFGKKMTFVITAKGKKEKLPFVSLLPYIIMIGLNITAFIFGLTKISNNFMSIGINMFWTLWHIFILSNIFYFNKTQKDI
jgi:cellulose synthase (UDP-forming)